MATSSEQRYRRAIEYATRAVESVSGSLWSSGPIDYYANREKTRTARQDLERIEERWWRASSDEARASVARQAELLADRIKENLPGAPQDWQRTNLTTGENERSAPATSYGSELRSEAEEAWSIAKRATERTADGLTSVGALLLLGGGLYVGSQLPSLLRSNKARQLVRELERAANREGRR